MAQDENPVNKNSRNVHMARRTIHEFAIFASRARFVYSIFKWLCNTLLLRMALLLLV